MFAFKISSLASASTELKKPTGQVNVSSMAAAVSLHSLMKRCFSVCQANTVTSAGSPSKQISETLGSITTIPARSMWQNCLSYEVLLKEDSSLKSRTYQCFPGSRSLSRRPQCTSHSLPSSALLGETRRTCLSRHACSEEGMDGLMIFRIEHVQGILAAQINAFDISGAPLARDEALPKGARARERRLLYSRYSSSLVTTLGTCTLRGIEKVRLSHS